MNDSRLQRALTLLQDAKGLLNALAEELPESPDRTTLWLSSDGIARSVSGIKAVMK